MKKFLSKLQTVKFSVVAYCLTAVLITSTGGISIDIDIGTNVKPREQLQFDVKTDTVIVSSKGDLVSISSTSAAPAEIDELPYDTIIANFVRNYWKIAKQDEEQYKIPAKIKMAQAILESRAGTSILAVKNSNYFGIKCFSNSCKKWCCSNFNDDSHKDFFKKYKSPEDSFEAHSNLLKNSRYKKCYSCGVSDYRCWANELSAAGYATDPKYASKIVSCVIKKVEPFIPKK